MKYEEIGNRYKELLPLHERLKDEIVYLLTTTLEKENIPYHQINGRVKPFDSFINKVERVESDEPFEEINDVCGVRVICLFLSDIEKIGKLVESNLDIFEKDDKIYSQPDAFGYLSVHYIAGLPTKFAGPRYDSLKSIKFEVQIRTIAMHAWATISHYLDYKSPLSIPSNLRKDFNALSAMFYIADTHFELFSQTSKENKMEVLDKATSKGIEDEEINLDTLSEYLKTKYPKRERASNTSVSILVEELQESGYDNIGKLDKALNRSQEAFKASEKDHPPGVRRKQFNEVGVVRVSLEILDEEYYKIGNKSKSWDEEVGKYFGLIKDAE